MKYLRGINNFQSVNEINNVNIHKTLIKKITEIKIPDTEHGDLKLSVFPFENTGEWVSLPEGFKIWEESFNEILKLIPLQEGCNTHYITIDSKFFTVDEFLRREGIHADGNFCVDPNFAVNEKSTWGGASYADQEVKSSWGGAKYDDVKSSWGGAKFDDTEDTEDTEDREQEQEYKASWGGASPKPTWGGASLEMKDGRYSINRKFEAKEDNSHVKMDWVLPYKLVIPIGDYISEKKGGILTVSTEIGCQGWYGDFRGEVLSEGAYTEMEDQLTDDKKIIFEKDSLYFMTSNTPHETLLIKKGKRRSFMRITLNHNYQNECIINK